MQPRPTRAAPHLIMIASGKGGIGTTLLATTEDYVEGGRVSEFTVIRVETGRPPRSRYRQPQTPGWGARRLVHRYPIVQEHVAQPCTGRRWSWCQVLTLPRSGSRPKISLLPQAWHAERACPAPCVFPAACQRAALERLALAVSRLEASSHSSRLPKQAQCAIGPAPHWPQAVSDPESCARPLRISSSVILTGWQIRKPSGDEVSM